jgi:hypothetical protein
MELTQMKFPSIRLDQTLEKLEFYEVQHGVMTPGIFVHQTE